MSDEVRKKLVDLVKRFGNGLASDSTRCRALLSDVCGANYRREVNVLVAAVTERSACELAIDTSLLPREVFFSRLAARLHDNLGITEDLAHWSIGSWALALRVVQPTELAIWETSRTGSSIKLPPRSIWGVGSTFRDCSDGPEMVVLPRGEFSMGSADDDEDRTTDEGPRHKVKIDYELAVGKYPVTFDQWDACVKKGGTAYQPPDSGWGRGSRPVINVSWEDIAHYLSWLSKATGKTYRLLSEAEWEYAARGGNEAPYSFGRNAKDLARYAWFDRNSSGKTHPVGKKLPNLFDLYDMHGNVWEWTEDCWNENYIGAPADGRAWTAGDCSRRVVRGGSWGSYPRSLRSAFRVGDSTALRVNYIGFRVARTD